MPERINCPCGKVLVVPDAAVGSTGICPVCGRELVLLPDESQVVRWAPSRPPGRPDPLPRLFQEPAAEPAAPDAAPPRPWRWRRWAVGAAAALALLGLSFWLAGGVVWGISTGIAGLLLFFSFTTITKEGLWREAGLAFLACLLVWGGWLAVGVFCRPTRVEVQTEHDLREAENAHVPVRVLYHGDEVLSFSDGKGRHFRRRFYSRQAVTVEVLRPEGWSTCPLNENYHALLTLRPGPLVHLYIDNRGGGPAAVACGAVRFDVPANAHLTRAVLAPSDPAAHPLTVNGQPAGPLTGRACLVDVSGTRTYRLRHVVYSSAGFAPLVGPAVEPRLLSGARVYEIPGKVEYFLTPAPDRITIKTFAGIGGVERRTELVDAH